MPPSKNVMVGMVSGMVFGFIDNAGLFLGMDVLDPFFSKSELIKAGQGNTFSDVIGTFLSTFIAIYIRNETGIDDSPIWADALGVFVGCLMGVYLPAFILGCPRCVLLKESDRGLLVGFIQLASNFPVGDRVPKALADGEAFWLGGDL